MNTLPKPSERRPRPLRWLAGGALLALTPKCALCLLAYAGLAAGVGGPELCGGRSSAGHTWSLWLAAAGGLSGLGLLLALRHRLLDD